VHGKSIRTAGASRTILGTRKQSEILRWRCRRRMSRYCRTDGTSTASFRRADLLPLKSRSLRFRTWEWPCPRSSMGPRLCSWRPC